MKKLFLLFFLSTLIPVGITLGAGGLEEQVEKESLKREQRLKPLRDAYSRCKKLILEGDRESACDQLTQAFDSLDDSLRATDFARWLLSSY